MPEWKQDLISILKRMGVDPLENFRVINVGVGNGIEGEGVLDRLSSLTLVDIAPRSLEAARSRLPRANAFVAAAERLKPIREFSQDVYLSLRTYQSSYFDIVRAIREGDRVLRPGGAFVISVANAFVGEEGAVLPGLVIPHTGIICDRPFEVAEKIRRHLTLLRFDDVGVRSGLDRGVR